MTTYRYDPTRTLTLRNRFASNINGRFDKFETQLKTEIFEYNILDQDESTIDRKLALLFLMFLSPGVGDDYIKTAYTSGVNRGFTELKKAKWYNRFFPEVTISLTQQSHQNRLNSILSLAESDLAGVIEATKAQILREIKTGKLNNSSKEEIWTGVQDRIDKVGKTRGRAFAATMVIMAFHQAMIQEYMNQGLTNVIVLAEYTTARDGKVCSKCKPYDKKVFTLEEIMGIIPVHPYCRCIALPYIITG